MPCGSLARSWRRSLVSASRGSPTKRYALASAAGPMKSGSASIERQEETQAPHWMQAIDWVTSIIDSFGTMYSRSGGSPSGSSQGVTRRILVQWVDSMSVTRSLITGMFPIGSTPTAVLPPPLELDWVLSPPTCAATAWLSAYDCASSSIVLQARVDWPLIFIP